MATISTNNSTFDNDISSPNLLIIVDFWAEWCGPCKQIGPILEELSEEMDGVVKIVKLDVDKNNQTAMNYSIRSIPTLMIIRDGNVKGQHIGAASKGQIEEFIQENT